MKLQSTLSACVLALGFTAAVQAQDIKFNLPGKTDAPAQTAPDATPVPAAAAPAAPTFTESQLLEEWGWLITQRIGISELELTPEQVNAFAKGITAGALAKAAPYDITKAGPQMDIMMKKKQEIYIAKLKAAGLAQTTAYFAEIKKKPGVIALPDGLCYEILAPGTGPAPKPTDVVSVNYTGKLVNGDTFDASREKPIEIGLDHVIAGWTEGLQKIAKGGKMKLYIPPQLAYGDQGQGSIPPGSTLIFDVELVDFKAAPPEAAEAAQPAATAPAPAPEAK